MSLDKGGHEEAGKVRRAAARGLKERPELGTTKPILATQPIWSTGCCLRGGYRVSVLPRCCPTARSWGPVLEPRKEAVEESGQQSGPP